MFRKLFLFAAFIIAGFMLLPRCARVGSISGGPKDTIPPRLLSSSPANNSTDFKANEFEVTFNEFLTLKEINSELLVSPPLKEQPTVLNKGKSFSVSFYDTLLTDATYTFNFGNSIVDYTESNPYKNFEYVFSTGSHIDSFSIRGLVLDAFELKPGKDKFTVLLYDNLSDTAPLKVKPYYVGRTNEKGEFTVNHIKPGPYNIFALKDGNASLTYDIATEAFAFSDSIKNITGINYLFHPDSLQMDSAAVADSLRKNPKADLKFPVFEPQIKLYSFVKEDKSQYMTNNARSTRRKINLTFNRPVDSLQVNPLNFVAQNWYLSEYTPHRDTVDFWITDSLIYKLDTIKLKVDYLATDSLLKLTKKTDTLVFISEKAEEPLFGRKRKEQNKRSADSILNVSFNVQQGGTLDLNRKLTARTDKPIASFNASKVKLFEKVDTIYVEQKKLNILVDSVFIHQLHLDFILKESAEYRILLDSGAVTDIYGIVNDSIMFPFKTQKIDYYGTLKVSLSHIKQPVLLQLLTDKGTLVKQSSLLTDGVIIFDYLAPAKYSLKAINDVNRNEKWDTGEYEVKKQPEKVQVYKDLIDVRSNWEIEQSWELE